MELPGLQASAKAADENRLLDPSLALSGRYVHLDITRICCIVCVVFSFFDERYATNNVVLNQNWVLPLLWVVCGVCFGLSEKPLHEYLGRLLLYAGIGLLVNWTSWEINGWRAGSFFWDMAAQMQFVMSLIGICLLLAPLKGYLRRLKEEDLGNDDTRELMSRDSVLCGTVTVFSGLLAITVGFALLAPSIAWLTRFFQRQAAPLGLDHTNLDASARAFVLYLQIVASGIWIFQAYMRFFPDRSLMPWILIINFYGHLVLFDADLGISRSVHFFHGLYLVMVALAALHLGLHRRRQLGKLVLRYWMVVAFVLGFLWPPGLVVGNLEPPRGFSMHGRYVLLEAIIVSGWLCAGQLLFDTKIYTQDKLAWVNDWALMAFITHRAVLWGFGFHMGWAVLLALGPVCLAGSWCARA